MLRDIIDKISKQKADRIKEQFENLPPEIQEEVDESASFLLEYFTKEELAKMVTIFNLTYQKLGIFGGKADAINAHELLN